MMATKGKALVIGGGIGGLAAALGLRRGGWEVEVYERAPEIREVGAGLTLWANGLRALELLGVGQAVREVSLPDAEGGVWSREGELLIPATGRELLERYGGLVALHRAELQRLLLDALGAEHVRCGAELAGFAQDARGVTARFADGSEAAGDVLVGADGLRSAVRAGVHGAAPPVYAGYTSWRAVLPFPVDRLRPGETWGPGARFGRVPLRDGRVYWYATRNAPEGARAAGGEKAELREAFRGWHDPVPALVEATDEGAILRTDLYDRPPLRRWGTGRVTLLGDAAHPMTPNLGQGAGQALEDAVVLARSLADAGDVEPALRRYEAVRAPRANAFVVRSRRVGQIGQWEHPVAVRLRTWLARHVFPRMQAGQLEFIAAHGL
jgi:2-polyprenyl-6-methoxyphenol hydroxylase-like FAD-dependent oxidoreductase